MLAYAPHYPVPRQEYWYFVLAEPAENAVLGMARVSLMEAEALAAEPDPQPARAAKPAAKLLTANGAAQQAAAADGDSSPVCAPAKCLQYLPRSPVLYCMGLAAAADAPAPSIVHDVHCPERSPLVTTCDESLSLAVKQDAAQPDSAKRQTVDIKFVAIMPGRKEYSLLVMSDCWIGVDVVVPVRLKVTASPDARIPPVAVPACRAALLARARRDDPKSLCCELVLCPWMVNRNIQQLTFIDLSCVAGRR